MHMLNKKDLNSAELEIVRVSTCPTTDVTASGEVQTKGETTVHVEELDLFVTVKLLKSTPTILSFEKMRRSRIVQRADHSSEPQLMRMTYQWLSWFIDKFFKLSYTYISKINTA